MRYLIIRAVRTEYDTVRSDSAPVLSRAVAVPRPVGAWGSPTHPPCMDTRRTCIGTALTCDPVPMQIRPRITGGSELYPLDLRQ